MRRLKTWNEECEQLVGPIAFGALKKAFLQLPNRDIKCLLETYGSLYGEGPKQYALKTLHGWRSRRVKISGQISYRLIELVPKYLSTTKRIEIFQLIVNFHEEKLKKNTISFVSFFDEDHRELLTRVVSLINQTENRFQEYQSKHNIPTENVLAWILDADIVAAREFLYLNKINHIKFLKSKAIEDLKRFCESVDAMGSDHGNLVYLKIDLGDIFVDITFKEGPKAENGAISIWMLIFVVIGIIFIQAFFEI